MNCPLPYIGRLCIICSHVHTSSHRQHIFLSFSLSICSHRSHSNSIFTFSSLLSFYRPFFSLSMSFSLLLSGSFSLCFRLFSSFFLLSPPSFLLLHLLPFIFPDFTMLDEYRDFASINLATHEAITAIQYLHLSHQSSTNIIRWSSNESHTHEHQVPINTHRSSYQVALYTPNHTHWLTGAVHISFPSM